MGFKASLGSGFVHCSTQEIQPLKKGEREHLSLLLGSGIVSAQAGQEGVALVLLCSLH